MQVERRHVGLEVEDVREVLRPIRHAAGTARVQIIEVAEEADLAVVIDIDVVARLRPDDVAADLDVARTAVDADAVAERRIDGVADDADIRPAVHRDARREILVDEIVDDDQPVARRDAHIIPRDAAELHRPAEAADARRVGLDQVRQIKRVAAENSAARHACRVAEDMLVLHLAGERDARRVRINLIRLRHADEAEAARRSRHRRDHARRVVMNLVRTQGCRRRVSHADRRTADFVPANHSREHRRDAQARSRRRHPVLFDHAR